MQLTVAIAIIIQVIYQSDKLDSVATHQKLLVLGTRHRFDPTIPNAPPNQGRITRITSGFAVGADLLARLPLQNKKQCEGLALLAAALDVRSVNLNELAAAVPRATERLDMDMLYQWIGRVQSALSGTIASASGYRLPISSDTRLRS